MIFYSDAYDAAHPFPVYHLKFVPYLRAVPGEYFCHLDASGRRYDADQRPELSKGTVEFVAPTEYMVRPPMPPSYFFLIDVSVSAVRSGLLEVCFICFFLFFLYSMLSISYN